MVLNDVKFHLRKRYLVTFFVFLGWAFMYLLRTNLSVSIVDMTSEKLVTVGNKSTIRAEFSWTFQEKGLLLSVFSWGYMTAPLGAVVAKRFGPVLTFGIGITLTGVLTISTPILISHSLFVYLIVRILEGFSEGLAASTFVDILKVWSSPSERSRIISMATSGGILGTVLGYPICGTIAFYLNWKAIFYFSGGVSLIWSMLWFSLIKNSPEDDILMFSQERKYLQQVNGSTSKEKVRYPWKKIITSKAVWAYWNSRFVIACSAAFLTYALPLFIKDIHNVDIQTIGFLSSIPNLTGIFGIIGGSFLADYLRSNGILSLSNVHRLFLSFGPLVDVTLLIMVCVWRNFIANMVCFSISAILIMGYLVSLNVLPVDMGGQYSCFILGCGITFAGVGLTLSPLVMGLIVTNNSATEWSIYFLVLSFVDLWGAIIFYAFGSGDLQSGAVPAENTEIAEQQFGKERNVSEVT